MESAPLPQSKLECESVQAQNDAKAAAAVPLLDDDELMADAEGAVLQTQTDKLAAAVSQEARAARNLEHYKSEAQPDMKNWRATQDRIETEILIPNDLVHLSEPIQKKLAISFMALKTQKKSFDVIRQHLWTWIEGWHNLQKQKNEEVRVEAGRGDSLPLPKAQLPEDLAFINEDWFGNYQFERIHDYLQAKKSHEQAQRMKKSLTESQVSQLASHLLVNAETPQPGHQNTPSAEDHGGDDDDEIPASLSSASPRSVRRTIGIASPVSLQEEANPGNEDADARTKMRFDVQAELRRRISLQDKQELPDLRPRPLQDTNFNALLHKKFDRYPDAISTLDKPQTESDARAKLALAAAKDNGQNRPCIRRRDPKPNGLLVGAPERCAPLYRPDMDLPPNTGIRPVHTRSEKNVVDSESIVMHGPDYNVYRVEDSDSK